MPRRNKTQISKKIKLSNAVRIFLIIISIVIFSIGSGNLIRSLITKEEIYTESKEKYNYTNRFTSNSKINLKDNDYIKESDITDTQTYLSDLISSIDMDMNYLYSDSKTVQVTYNYKIEALVKASYTSNNQTYDVLNKSELLKQSEDKTTSSNNLSIVEKINVDYSKYHEMIKEFKQSMGISANSYLYIKLTVNTKTNIDGEEIVNQYVSDYNITLGDKVALISENSNDEVSQSVKYEEHTKSVLETNYLSVILSLVIMLAGLIMFRIVTKNTEKLNIIKNEYKLELNRILKSCESKIVEIEDLNQVDLENATKVKDVTQLLKLSDEALVPIYCYIKEESDEEEAYFIVTKYDRSYIFILK